MKPRDGTLDRLQEVLKTAGCRMTHQRIEVFRAVGAHASHPCVSEVFEIVRETLPSVSLDTVYRTLWKLSELGLVNPVTSSGDKMRFDANTRRHHHFVCARCGGTYDFESPSLDGVRVPEEAWQVGTVWGAHMEVRGLCTVCCRDQKDISRNGG